LFPPKGYDMSYSYIVLKCDISYFQRLNAKNKLKL
jgi:hypothetical protein